MFTLKRYQQETLKVLRKYLENARLNSPSQAFSDIMKEQGIANVLYNTYGLGNIPYVCLRLPTGGGKTILASYAIKEASSAYLEKDYPLVLWIVPTTTIKEQTMEALCQPGHPYRQALDEYFSGKVSIYDIKNVTQIRPVDLINKVCIVLTTIASLRVENKDGRRIYDHNEYFQDFFERARFTHIEGLDVNEEGPDRGKIKYSFANLCHINHPLIIVDEAHNARTSLTYDTLSRLSPDCIIEFTATPNLSQDNGSNVLYSISASELKAEDMIKLPIRLVEHQNWQNAVHDAILMRDKLAKIAQKDQDFIRPITLLQAESKDRDVTVDVLRNYLISEEKISPDKIAVATGSQRELDDVNLFDPKCSIEYIITIEALKEGWDCSFAYVFCSVSNISSDRDVEQILGRVLRMPYAVKRSQKELNMAYAFVSSPNFAEAAANLKDNLIHMGFEELEARIYIQPQYALFEESLKARSELREKQKPLVLELSTAVDVSKIDKAVKVEKQKNKTVIQIDTLMTEKIKSSILNSIGSSKEKEDVKEQILRYQMAQKKDLSPSERGESFSVPRVGIMVQGEFEFADEDLFLEIGEWALLKASYELTPQELSITETAHAFEVDVEGKKVRFHELSESFLFNMDDYTTMWTINTLIQWLDRQIRQPDVAQLDMVEFLRRAVQYLIDKRKFSLGSLVRARYLLSKALLNKIQHIRKEAIKKGYQKVFFGDSSKAQLNFDYCFKFEPGCYPAKPPYYNGSYQFQKHFYPIIGEIKEEGEELDCAIAIDRLPNLKYWVRNLSRHPDFSFWLPTSSDKFYPDFACLLDDGRLLVVEYKGGHLLHDPETLEKDNIGKLWESLSKGKALFLMAVKKDESGRDVYKQLLDKINKTS